MFSSNRKLTLLFLISLFCTYCHGQSSTTSATTSMITSPGHDSTTGSADVSVTATTENKNVSATSTYTTISTAVGSHVTESMSTGNASFTVSIPVETTHADFITQNTTSKTLDSGLTTEIHVSAVEGTISSSTSNLTTGDNSTSQTASTTASPNNSSTAITKGLTTENTTSSNMSIEATTKHENTSDVSTTAPIVNGTTHTTHTGNTTHIPNVTESAPTSNSTATSESTGTTASYTQSTVYATTTNSSGSGMAGGDKDSGSSTGVVLGAVIGSILGIALVCITAYIIIGNKKSGSFSHRRLYEETRNDPVLRLDNPASPYDVSYGDSSYYNPSAIEEPPYHRRPHEAIAMDDIRPH